MKSATDKIIGLAKLNLEPEQDAYLLDCVSRGRCFFVTRKRSMGRCLQASGPTLESVLGTLKGWPGSTLIEIRDGKVIWHKIEEKQ